MNRRDFVAAAGGASLLPTLGSAEDAAQGVRPGGGLAPQVLELRRYRLKFGPMEARFADYQKSVLLPALNRVGVKPVGAFSVLVGPDTPAIHLLLPHPNADSVLTLAARLSCRRRVPARRGRPSGACPRAIRPTCGASRRSCRPLPPRRRSRSHRTSRPRASRVFELRTYESHNEAAGAKKIEMFEKAGEIAIFRRRGPPSGLLRDGT